MSPLFPFPRPALHKACLPHHSWVNQDTLKRRDKCQEVARYSPWLCNPLGRGAWVGGHGRFASACLVLLLSVRAALREGKSVVIDATNR